MSDQPTKNVAFELQLTNATLLILANTMLDLVEPNSAAAVLISKEMEGIERRIQRLDQLRK